MSNGIVTPQNMSNKTRPRHKYQSLSFFNKLLVQPKLSFLHLKKLVFLKRETQKCRNHHKFGRCLPFQLAHSNFGLKMQKKTNINILFAGIGKNQLIWNHTFERYLEFNSWQTNVFFYHVCTYKRDPPARNHVNGAKMMDQSLLQHIMSIDVFCVKNRKLSFL